eukprot:267500-Prymnesium_polylepis.1
MSGRTRTTAEERQPRVHAVSAIESRSSRASKPRCVGRRLGLKINGTELENVLVDDWLRIPVLKVAPGLGVRLRLVILHVLGRAERLIRDQPLRVILVAQHVKTHTTGLFA